ncbi:hypothetical protein C8F01DRAFT_1082178 [Mycena amicta]|nr:hypothetical protein C8F01DRAFT_1082178 [Mycena amicta]
MAVRSRAFNFECPLVDSNGLSLTEQHQDPDLGQVRCFYGLTDHECDYSLSDGSPNGTEVQDCPAVANAAPKITVIPQTITVCAQNRVSEEGKFVVHRVTGDHDLAELADLAPPIPLTESAPGTGTSSPLLRPPPPPLLGLPGAEPFRVSGDPFETIPPEPDAESDPHFDERGGNHPPSDEASLDLAETPPGLALDVENALLRERIEMMEAEIQEQRRVENHLPSNDASLAETTPGLALDFERENALLRERIEMMAAEIQEQRDFLAQMDVFPPQYRSRSVSSVSTSTD